MTERWSTSGEDGSIRCDICGIHGFNDPREPWDIKESRIPKPTYRCKDCNKSVIDAREQKKYLNEYENNKAKT